MTTRSAAVKLRRLSLALEGNIVTPAEFGSAGLGLLIDKADHDPIPLMLTLPESHQQLIVAEVQKLSGIGDAQREYHSQARIVCEAIVSHYQSY